MSTLSLRLGFGRFSRRRRELEEGRAAIAHLASVVNQASDVLTAPMHARDLEDEVSGVHETIPSNERRSPR